MSSEAMKPSWVISVRSLDDEVDDQVSRIIRNAAVGQRSSASFLPAQLLGDLDDDLVALTAALFARTLGSRARNDATSPSGCGIDVILRPVQAARPKSGVASSLYSRITATRPFDHC